MASRELLGDALRYLSAVAVLLAVALCLARDAHPSIALALVFYSAVAGTALLGLRHHPHRRFGLANALTTARIAILSALVAIGVAEAGPERPAILLSALAFAGLLLDGVDGWAARRFGTASAYGARFDLEIDALTVLVLSLLVARSGQAGYWVLSLGLARYAFVAAGRAWPALARPVPPSVLRKAICVAVVASLSLALAPIPAVLAGGLCAAAVIALIYSFGSDCVWLLRAGRMAERVSRPRRSAV